MDGLTDRGIVVGKIFTNQRNARLAAVTDPEGNTIHLIENQTV